jgi:branched-chain amino acid transport system permease protein
MPIRIKGLQWPIFILIMISIPVFIRDEYFLHLFIEAGFFYMLVAGLNLLVGYLGQLSLGHTAFLGVGAYTSALMSLKLGAPFWICLASAVILSFVLSFFFGIIVLRLRGPYFVIVSLCFAEMLAIVAINWVDLTNGPMGLPGIDAPQLFGYVFDSKTSMYYLMLVLVSILTYILHCLTTSHIGRACVSLRENEELAESIGISAFKFGMIAFVTASVFAAVGGSFYAHYMSYLNPEIFGFGYMITMLVMLVTGGKGTIVGPILGCLIFTLLPEFLREIKELREPIFGLILIVVAVFMPQGLKGLIDRVTARISARVER